MKSVELNWSYIAGFVDGEGSIVKCGETDYRVLVSQTNEEVLELIKKFAGVGRICQLTKRKSHWKESWLYFVGRQEDVLYFLKSVQPYLIVKRDLVERTIPEVSKIVLQQKAKRLRLQKNVETSKFLRRRGFSYRAIGGKLRIDHGYVRRLILFGGRNK